MNRKKIKIPVRLGNSTFKITISEDEKECLQNAIGYINKQITNLSMDDKKMKDIIAIALLENTMDLLRASQKTSNIDTSLLSKKIDDLVTLVEKETR